MTWLQFGVAGFGFVSRLTGIAGLGFLMAGVKSAYVRTLLAVLLARAIQFYRSRVAGAKDGSKHFSFKIFKLIRALPLTVPVSGRAGGRLDL